jgi:hypothetical protein
LKKKAKAHGLIVETWEELNAQIPDPSIIDEIFKIQGRQKGEYTKQVWGHPESDQAKDKKK